MTVFFTDFTINLPDATITGFLCTRENPFELVVDTDPDELPVAGFLFFPKPGMIGFLTWIMFCGDEILVDGWIIHRGFILLELDDVVYWDGRVVFFQEHC